MKALPFKSFFGTGSSVKAVAEERVARVSHMHADLMGPSRFKDTFYKGLAAVSLNNTPMCNGISRIALSDGHALPVGPVSAYGSVHGAAVLSHSAADHGQVFTVKAVV